MNPYRLLYRFGITLWERDSVPRPVIEVSELYASPGRALDVGCGTGRDAVHLASLGWTVTGVDSVPRAVDTARRRAHAAAVTVNWVLGDVTRLQTLRIGDGYDLLLDRGCFHGLTDDERERCASAATAVAAPGARLLMFAFQPRGRALGPRGITREQLQHHFEDLGRSCRRSATPSRGCRGGWATPNRLGISCDTRVDRPTGHPAPCDLHLPYRAPRDAHGRNNRSGASRR